MPGPTGEDEPPLFLGALRFRGAGFRVFAGTNEAEVDGAGGATPDWAAVLAEGNNSGAFNPHIDAGQFIGFGVEGSLPGTGQIRSSASFSVIVTGTAAMTGTTSVGMTSDGNGLAATPTLAVLGAGSAGVTVNDNGSVQVRTNDVERLEIELTGGWQLGGLVGTAVQYIRSSGPGAPPTWATISVGELGAIGANTVVTNPTPGSAAPSTTAMTTHSALARIGGNIVSHSLSTLAGDGLGYNSVDGSIFVGAGSFITVAADSISVNLAALVPAIDSASIVVNGTVLERAAVTGAVALAQNGNVSRFAGVRTNGVLQTARQFLNLIDSTTVLWTPADDAGNDEWEMRARHVFGNVRDNGSLETARGFLNFVSVALDTTVSVTQDAANDELEVRVSTLGSFYSENSVGSFQTKFISFDNGTDTLANVVDNTGGSGFVNVSYDVNKAANFSWTGDHTWTGVLDWSADITGPFGARCTQALSLESQNDDVRITAGINIELNAANVRLGPISGTGAFLTLDGGTASTPGVLAGDGMYWVEDPGAAPTEPRFTDDTNVDWALVQFQRAQQLLSSFGSGDVHQGTPFVLTKQILSQGVATPGDGAIYAAGTAPFDFRVLFAVFFPTSSVAGSSLVLRDAAGGGGQTLGAAMSGATAGVYSSFLGAGTDADPVISAGGQLFARMSNRTMTGILWLLCMRI